MNYMLYFLISIICINYSLGNIQEIKNIPEVQVKYSDLKFYQNTSEITIDITDSEKSRKMFSLGKEIILFNHQEQVPCNAIGSFSFLFSEDGSIGRVKLFFKTELEKVLNGTLTVLTSQKTVPLKEKIIKIKKDEEFNLDGTLVKITSVKKSKDGHRLRSLFWRNCLSGQFHYFHIHRLIRRGNNIFHTRHKGQIGRHPVLVHHHHLLSHLLQGFPQSQRGADSVAVRVNMRNYRKTAVAADQIRQRRELGTMFPIFHMHCRVFIEKAAPGQSPSAA